MSSSSDKAKSALNNIGTIHNLNTLIDHIKHKQESLIIPESLPGGTPVTLQGINNRLDYLVKEAGHTFSYLTGKKSFEEFSQLEGNIENYIGMTTVPTGVVGPLKVIGSSANGDFYIPLATSEGALVASYHRGAKACYQAGGVTSICMVEGVQRSPVFKFKDLSEVGTFLVWLYENHARFNEITVETSRYAKLTDLRTNIEGNHVILIFEYQTGDAAGQNMVTICTQAICEYIIEHSPVKPEFWFIESNYSGDKKATALSFSSVRGKKVTSEITLSEKIVHEVLKTTPKAMEEYWKCSTIGTIQSGSIGAQGHYANGLTALFLATGQDVACIAEAAVGITRMEVDLSGNLYACVTLPNMIVGTVGGGTSLPTQKECLELMDCYGAGKSKKFAEICGALVLAGELSIAAALSAGHFSAAHKKLGRKQ